MAIDHGEYGSHGMDAPRGEILVYQADDGRVRLDVRLQDETVWLAQANMADLFQVKPQNITMHLKNIYAEGELLEEATCKEFLQVQMEGNRQVERSWKFYNLDAIISVGYQIQSHHPAVETTGGTHRGGEAFY